MNEVRVTIETVCTQNPIERFHKICNSICVINSALKRKVISLNTRDNSVIFENLSVHSISYDWIRMVINSNICDTFKYPLLVFFNLDYKTWIYLNKYFIYDKLKYVYIFGTHCL